MNPSVILRLPCLLIPSHLSLSFVLLISFSACSQQSLLSKAQELESSGSYAEARDAYEKYFAQLLEQNYKTPNPYFYQVIIGDLELKLGNPDLALERYQTAIEHDVNKGLLSDRIRLLADWWENAGEADRSLALFQQYRFLDPQSFDYELSQLHRRIVAREQNSTSDQLD